MKKLTLIFLVFLSISNCATPYQPKGVTGGFSDVQLAKDTFMISFRGNGFTSAERVEIFLLYRCAELTVDNGYDYFVILKKNAYQNQEEIATPGYYESNTYYSGGVYGNGNIISGYGRTQGTYVPGQTISVTKHGARVMIKTFRGEKPADNPDAFAAKDLMEYLSPYTDGR